jgi:hypothetical protein
MLAQAIGECARLGRKMATLAPGGLVNPPERKGATRFETWIPVINEVQAAIVVRADRGLLFPEGQGIE